MVSYHISSLEISPDKQFIAAAGNPVVRLYEISNSEARLTLEGHKGNITALGFQKEGNFIYTSSEDGTIKLWDLRSSSFSRSWNVGSPCNSVCLRTDRDELISGDQNGHVKIWDLGQDGRGCVHSVQPSTTPSSATSLSTSQQEENNTTGSGRNNDTKPSSLDIKGERLDALQSKRRVYADDPIKIQSVDISDDSRTLVALSTHGLVFAWDPSSLVDGTLRPVTQFRAHDLGVYGLHAKISPDSRHLVTTGSDGTAKLWDTITWHQTKLLNQPKWVWDAAFCADSSYLVTSSSDNVARLWNLRDGDVVRSFFGHSSAVTCVALNDCSE